MEGEQSHIHQHLVKKAKQFDTSAQTTLYESYAKAMLNVAYRIVYDRAAAEDLMQDAFIEAFNKINQFKEEASFGSWLKRIVINRSINYVNRQKMIYAKEEEYVSELEAEEDQAWKSQCNMEDVREGLKLLAKKHRIVFSLYMIEGYDHDEIGEILNISSSTSRSQLSRAKTNLREIILKNKKQYV